MLWGKEMSEHPDVPDKYAVGPHGPKGEVKTVFDKVKINEVDGQFFIIGAHFNTTITFNPDFPYKCVHSRLFLVVCAS